MRHLRVSVSVLVSLLVASATIGSLYAASHAYQTVRRRGQAVRITRVGTTRLDQIDLTCHEVEQHDPVIDLADDGVPPGPRALAPPGPRHAVATQPHPVASILLASAERAASQDRLGLLCPDPLIPLKRGTSRLALGRAPPATPIVPA